MSVFTGDTSLNQDEMIVETLHPSLRDTFTPFSPIGTRLSPEEIYAVFGGDPSALKDMYRLVLKAQTDNLPENINRSD